jgi:hypothetical protein
MRQTFIDLPDYTNASSVANLSLLDFSSSAMYFL